jgi:hypothetical protein
VGYFVEKPFAESFGLAKITLSAIIALQQAAVIAEISDGYGDCRQQMRA